MRVLVTGAGGQLGSDLVDAFHDHDVTAASRAELDVGDEAVVAHAVGDGAPHLVVNAAAWTDVDGCETDPDHAHRVNALGPWWLARACQRAGAVLVHVSTDYVFGGQVPTAPDGSARPYTEVDPAAPVNAYGRSKLAGEQLVRAALHEHHIVRTGWLCGAHGNNFVRTILTRARDGDEIRVVDDEIGSPTYTRDLAAAVRQLAVTGRYGTLHLTNAGACSRFELAVAALELAGVDAEVQRQAGADLERPAPRPSWSVLEGRHARLSGVSPLPPWQDALQRLVVELGHRGAPEPGRRPTPEAGR